MVQDQSREHDAPVIVAGDIFDKWNAPVELVNFLLENINRPFYCVPGQHDLPYHSIEAMKRTAYYSLVCAGKIIDIQVEFPEIIGTNVRLWAFPWGMKITPLPEDAKSDLLLEVAVCHHYVWQGECKHPEAEKKDHVSKLRKKLEGYDVAVFGDNHKGFLYEEEGFCLFNGGTLMRRKSDERDYRPHVGLLFSDGRVERQALDTSRDKFITNLHENGPVGDEIFLPFLEKLSSMTDAGLDFEDALKRTMKKMGVSKEVREIIMECMEGKSE